MSRRILLLIASHLLVAALGFGLGVYLLPILVAPDAPQAEVVSQALDQATYRTTFRRDLEGSDALHWAEGRVGVGPRQIAFDGKIAPGPDYRVYLTRRYVDTPAAFLAVKEDARHIGEVKTFNRFLIDVPTDVDIADYTTVVVWCERFSKFISAGEYRHGTTAAMEESGGAGR